MFDFKASTKCLRWSVFFTLNDEYWPSKIHSSLLGNAQLLMLLRVVMWTKVYMLSSGNEDIFIKENIVGTKLFMLQYPRLLSAMQDSVRFIWIIFVTSWKYSIARWRQILLDAWPKFQYAWGCSTIAFPIFVIYSWRRCAGRVTEMRAGLIPATGSSYDL